MAPTNRFDPLATYNSLPEIVSGYPLPPHFSIVVPAGEDRTNWVENPSFETDTNNWTGLSASIAATTTFQWAGARSARLFATTALGAGAFYGGTTPFTTSSSAIYAGSISFYSPVGGALFDFYVADTSGNRIAGRQFRATGFWQREWFVYKEGVGAQRRLYITLLSTSQLNKFFYIDAVQFEPCSAGKVYPTTYIDGDQRGFTPGEYPVPYYWIGTPHASRSVRVQSTRAGGRVLNLSELGFIVTSYAGLGAPTPTHSTQVMGSLDGAAFQRSVKGPRKYSISGRVAGRSSVLLENSISSVLRDLDIDIGPDQQPFIMKFQPMDEEGFVAGHEVDIISTYDGGGEGNRNNFNAEQMTLTFTQYAPFIMSHTEGVDLDPQDTLSNVIGAVKRATDGTWSALSTGFSASATIYAIAPYTDGSLFIGGSFTSAGSTSADYVARYFPSTNVFTVLKSATAVGNTVTSIVVTSDGIVYLGGLFLNVDGIAAADGIVKYNPNTDTFSALGSGIDIAAAPSGAGAVWTLAYDPLTQRIYVGGDFENAGGVAAADYIAAWSHTGSTWSALGTGMTGGTGERVRKIVVKGDYVYASGSFPSAGGAASSQRAARFRKSTAQWFGMSAGAGAEIVDLAFGPDGLLYMAMTGAGSSYSIGGITTNPLVTWNEVTFQSVGPAGSFNAGIDALQFLSNGTLVFGGLFTAVNGITYPDFLGAWDGGGFYPIQIDTGANQVLELGLDASASLYVGMLTTVTTTASVPGVATATNGGTSKTYPVVLITASVTSTRIYSISILNTNRIVYLDYTMNPGEQAILNFDPLVQTFKSTVQGDIARFISIGSMEADFMMTKGDNRIAVLASTTNLTITAYWQKSFLSLSDAVGKI